MAEENNDYWHRLTFHQLSDAYARSALDPAVLAPVVLLLGFEAALATFAWQALGTRSHQQWLDGYNAVGGDTGYHPTDLEK